MTTRRATGGMIRQHPARGLWEARYVGADGRKHSVYAKSRAAAQERLRAALTAADNGLLPTGSRLTVAAYLGEWLASSVPLRCRPRTVESYQETVERYIVPAIGSVPLTRLTPEHVARMLANLTARGTLSPTTVAYSRAILRIALGRALKSGLVTRNVATLVDAPVRVVQELSPMTAEQVGDVPRRGNRRSPPCSICGGGRARAPTGRAARAPLV